MHLMDLSPAIFLDRDGVLNQVELRSGRPHPPTRPEDLRLVPGAPEACAALQNAGYRLFVVTNQPDVARGLLTRPAVESIHARLSVLIPGIDEFLVCYHDDADGCGCRKPKAGLILDLVARHQLDLSSSFVVGDRWRDIEAGVAAGAGCRTVFIDYGYDERKPANPTASVKSVTEAACWILAQQQPH